MKAYDIQCPFCDEEYTITVDDAEHPEFCPFCGTEHIEPDDKGTWREMFPDEDE